jgi:hypothetical protein
MNKQTFIAVATALSATIGFAQAGIVTLPIDEVWRAVAAFALGIVATFLASFIKAETP